MEFFSFVLLLTAATICLLAWWLGIAPAAVALAYLAGVALTFLVLLAARLISRPIVDALPAALVVAIAWPVTVVGALCIEGVLRAQATLEPVWRRACQWWESTDNG